VGVIPAPQFLRKESEDSLQQAIRIIKENKAEIIAYGEDIPFEDAGMLRKIDHIDKMTLKRGGNKKYSFLVINDLNNTVTLSEKTIQLIREYVQKPGYAVMYFGDNYLSSWDENRFVTNVDGGRSVVHQNESGNVVRIIGNWGKEEQLIAKGTPYFQSQIILYQVESFIRANN